MVRKGDLNLQVGNAVAIEEAGNCREL